MKLKNCPFCGSKPNFPESKDVFGTCYDCGCDDCGLVQMSTQIIDCFDHPRDHVHKSWNEDEIQYGIEFIEVARNEAIEAWNTRDTPEIEAAVLRRVADELSKGHVCLCESDSFLREEADRIEKGGS